MPSSPAASILIPTRRRPAYLDVALGSIAPQASRAGAELVVVSDGGDPATRAVAERHGARVIEATGGDGANAARNAGVAATVGDPVVFVDDDVLAPPGWLQAMLDGVREYPDHDVFGGPIRADLEEAGHARAAARSRRSRRSTSAPTTVTPSWCGARTWRFDGKRSLASARSTSRSTAAARRRTGSVAIRRPGGGSGTSPARGSITDGPAPTRRCRACRRPPMRWGGPRAATTPSSQPRRRSRVS